MPRSYPLALAVALMACLPLLVLFDLAEAPDRLLDPRNLELLLSTAVLTVSATAGAVLLGVPLAFLSTCVRLPWHRVWLVLFAAPLALPSYLGAFTAYAAFGPGGEIVRVFGVSTPRLYGLAGGALIMALYTYPFVLLTTRAALLGLDASLVSAARTLGLPLWRCLLSIVLPRVYSAITAGALLAALYTLSDFGTPAIMGVDTFTRLIYVEYNAFGLPQAALLSLQLLAFVGLVLFVESRMRARAERPGQTLQLWPSRTRVVACLALAAPITLMAIGLPLAVFGLWLWREGAGGFDPGIAWNSMLIALIAALAAVLLALPVAQAAQAGPFGRLLERISYFGFGVPGIVMGTALVFVGLRLPALYQTFTLLILGYACRFLPLAVGAIRSSTERLESGITNAARSLGAPPREVFMRITLPLTLPGVLAGAALVFLEVMRELPATLLLAPTGFETLATYLWRVYEAGYFGRAAIPGLMLVLMSAFGLALILTGERRAEFAVSQGEGQ